MCPSKRQTNHHAVGGEVRKARPKENKKGTNRPVIIFAHDVEQEGIDIIVECLVVQKEPFVQRRSTDVNYGSDFRIYRERPKVHVLGHVAQILAIFGTLAAIDLKTQGDNRET